MRRIIIILLTILSLWIVVAMADYEKPLLVLIDTLDPACGASADCAQHDSTSWFFHQARHFEWEFDSLNIGSSPHLFSGTNAQKREAFKEYCQQYQAVVIPQLKIAIVGDTSSTDPVRGLQNWMVNGLYDYLYEGGGIFQCDYWVNKWAYVDTQMFKIVLNLTYHELGGQQDLIIYRDNPVFAPYLKNSLGRDTIEIAAVDHEPGFLGFTSLGSDVDTLVMLVNPARPYMLGYNFGHGGYLIQVFGGMKWLYCKYDGNRKNLTYGSGAGLDYLVRGPIEFLTSRKAISISREFPPTIAGRIDDIPTDFYEETAGAWLGLGIPMRISIYIHETDSDDSAYFREMHQTGLMSFSIQSFDGDDDGIYINLVGPAQWSVVDWGKIRDSIYNATELTGSGDYKGLLTGLIVDRSMTPTGHRWGVGVDSCVFDTLLARGIHVGDCFVGPYDDWIDTYLHGKPYTSFDMTFDWYRDKTGDSSWSVNKLMKVYYRPDSSWNSRGAPDLLVRGLDWLDEIGPFNNYPDSLNAIMAMVGYYMNKAIIAGVPGLFYVHGSTYASVEAVHGGIYEDILNAAYDTLNSYNPVFVTNLYNEMLALYRDSVTVANYQANENSASFTLVHRTAGNTMDMNLTYTCRRTIDEIVYLSTAFVPANWDSAINISVEFDPREKTWKFMPSFNAVNGVITANSFGTDGWW